MFDFLHRKPKATHPEVTVEDAIRMVSELRDLVSHEGLTADGLQNVVAGLGTARDKRTFTGYSLVTQLQYMQIETMCRSNWLAKNIVEVRGKDMVREWVDVQWDGKDQDKDRQQAITEVEDQFQIRTKFEEGVLLGRQYGGAALVFGIKGQNDLSQPLDIETLGEGCLEYIHAFDRWQLSATGLMDQAGDLASPNFRKPGFFTLGGSEAEAGVSVHWSRVILFHGRWLPYRPWLQNGMWHDSELQHVIDDVKDYGSVMALLATMFFEANVDVMLVNGLAKLLSLPHGSQKVNERFAIAAQQKGANRILIMDALDKYEKKGNNFTGLGAIVDDFRLNVAAAAKTPVTKLFGMAPGGLNATGQSDEDNYNASVKQEQAGWLYQNIWRMYQVLFRHRFGSVPPNLKITFNPLTQETKKERSDRLFVDAQRDQIYAGPQGIGAMTPHGIAKELKEHNVYATQETDDVSAIKEADEAATEQQLEQAKQMALAASGKGGAQPPAPGAPAQPPKV